MFCYKDTSDAAKKAVTKKLHTKKSNSWPMVSFIHDGSDITTWRKHSFKTKKHKIQCNILNVTMSFLNFKLQINRFAQGHWS